MKVTFIACICALIALGTDLGSAAARASAAEPIEEIVVTGSRIGRSTTTTPIPVTTLDAEAIALDGENRVADIVNELPSLRTTQTPANSNFSEQEAGTNFLDLRGLGIDRTLVLIDGRRQVGGRPGSAALDTNTIPTALVERVEIITGGASTSKDSSWTSRAALPTKVTERLIRPASQPAPTSKTTAATCT